MAPVRLDTEAREQLPGHIPATSVELGFLAVQPRKPEGAKNEK
jgi:hypothetical protein